MTKSFRVISFVLLLGIFLFILSACKPEMDSDRFISILKDNEVGASVIKSPDDEDPSEIIFGSGMDQEIYFFLYQCETVEDAKIYYDDMKKTLVDLSLTSGTEGQCVETGNKKYTKCVADLKYAENDGTGEGTYAVLIMNGRSVITIMTKGLSTPVIEKVNHVVKELGY